MSEFVVKSSTLNSNYEFKDVYPNGNEMMYDLSQMKRADSELVWDAIEAIEAEVLG